MGRGWEKREWKGAGRWEVGKGERKGERE